MAFAFFAVGRQRKVDAFKLLLLSIAGAVAFRTMRDAWFICIPAAACIADTLADESESEPKETWLQKLAVAAVVAVALLLFARSTDFNTRGLDRAISSFLAGECGELSAPASGAGAALQHARLGRLSHLVHAELSRGHRRAHRSLWR